MPLQIRNTKELIHPDKFKWKLLVFGLAGTGKTEFCSDAPSPGIAAAETGQGRGLLTIARKGLDYVELLTYQDFEAFCSGSVFKDKESLVLDSLSDSSSKFIKTEALRIPRKGGDSGKRALGIAERDDFMSMAEIMRKNVNKLIEIDKHIVCTALLKIREPDSETGKGEYMVGPDLPGALMMGSCALFDTVMCLRTRSKLRDPKDAKSRYTERYFVSGPDGNGLIAKCRSVVEGGVPLLPQEIVWDIKTGEGSFPDLLGRIRKAYAEFYEKNKIKEAVAV